MCQEGFFLFEVNCNQRLFPVPVYKMLATSTTNYNIYTTDTSIMVFYMQITIKSFLSIFGALALTVLITSRPNYLTHDLK